MILNNAKDIRLGSSQVDRVYVGNNLVYGIPKGYTRCKYLRNVGLIGIKVVLPDTVDCRAKIILRNKKVSGRSLMGISLSAGDYFGVDANGRFEVGGGFYIPNDIANPFEINEVNVELLENQRINLTVNDTTITRSGTTRTSNIFSLFFTGSSDSAYLGVWEIYKADFHYKNKLFRSLIPCLNAENKPCFFDVVSSNEYLGIKLKDEAHFDYEI